MPVFEFFARFGEPAFRALETEVLSDACSQTGMVIASGGGIVTRPENWLLFRPGSVVVGLAASPETLVSRIDAQSAGGSGSAVRPLLAGDPIERIRQLLADRGLLYAQADVVVDTEGQDVQAVVDQIVAAVTRTDGSLITPAFSLQGATERSDIYVRAGSRLQVAALARSRWPRARRAWIVSDSNVAEHWVTEVEGLFSEGEFSVQTLIVPPGESSKSFEQVERLCLEMTRDRVSRQDVVVALGGGVVGDLAGFVASICLRGLALIQLPTSLLAMVDSSVGGKTGINTAAGKNLVGAFNQPGLVVVDPEFLTTLSSAEYRSGMAEVIKHSIIQPSTPLGGTNLGATLQSLSTLAPVPADRIEDVLRQNVAIKHSVVEADERESGLRMILNFGHTAGHAIEADGYRYRHGEAVALGMLVAARLARDEGLVDTGWVDNLQSTLSRAGLPVQFEARADDVVARLSHDKKNVDGALNWILPVGEGGVRVTRGIDIHRVRRSLQEVGAE